MYLQKISLANFKSYEYESYVFSERVNCVVGENGIGKTNLLDAIYFLALTKSSISNQDALSINHEAEYMMIEGSFEIGESGENITPITNNQSLITISIQRGQKKAVLRDKKAYERISEHIGKFPVVMLSPNDTDVIRDGSEERRKFFDGVMAQLDSEYLENLLQYNRLLLQRNSLLKQFSERNYVDDLLLDIYSDPLVEVAVKIHQAREQFVTQFLPLFKKHYATLSDAREEVEMIYESEVGAENFTQIFRKNRPRDLAAQRTTMGIHKDDFAFEINGFTLRKFGSQGQQKSFVIALKLAQFEMLSQQKGFPPILLLDDIFDKLDDRRIQQLITMMVDGTFSQVFITDARPERTRQLLDNLGVEVKYFEIVK
ncbi:DNA replication/repair protein RecF [Arcicella aurantiaca]|nr:DNA replication/repair protein RecF [Arcicella aurantiaca]